MMQIYSNKGNVCPLVALLCEHLEQEDRIAKIMALFFTLGPIEECYKGNVYSFTMYTVQNFIGQAVQSAICHDLNTTPVETLLKDAHRVPSECECLSKRFLIVSNQAKGIRKKEGKRGLF